MIPASYMIVMKNTMVFFFTDFYKFYQLVSKSWRLKVYKTDISKREQNGNIKTSLIHVLKY